MAELFGRHLLIFSADEKLDSLQLMHEYKPAKSQACEILFFTDHIERDANGATRINKNVHFDRLYPDNVEKFKMALATPKKPSVEEAKLKSMPSQEPQKPSAQPQVNSKSVLKIGNRKILQTKS